MRNLLMTGAAVLFFSTTTYSAESCFSESVNFDEFGPHQVDSMDIGGSTLYYPKDTNDNCKYPLVAWGNGTGVIGTATYSEFFKHMASWGMFVTASHSGMTGNGSAFFSAIEKAKNTKLKDKMSEKIGTAGHSQGGGGAVAAAGWDKVDALVSVQGCVPSNGKGFSKPGLYITGSMDMCRMNLRMLYNNHTGPAVYASYSGADHVYTPSSSGIRANSRASIEYRSMMTAWFSCHLQSRDEVCALFDGNKNSEIAEDAAWSVIESKNMN